jgi:hypothetical protein
MTGASFHARLLCLAICCEPAVARRGGDRPKATRTPRTSPARLEGHTAGVDGWLERAQGRRATPSRFATARCTIDRLPAVEAARAFGATYAGRRPLLITGLFGGSGLPPALGAFSRGSLLADHGHRRVSVGRSASIPLHWHWSADKLHTLEGFVELMEARQAPLDTEPLYMFDKTILAAEASATGGALHDVVLNFIPDWVMGGVGMAGRHYSASFLTMGAAESGVQFHRHNEGWNLLLAGAKRWFLFPPDRMPTPHYPASYIPIRDWVDDHYPGLPQLGPSGATSGLAECVQRRGELLYVPEGWYHATVNLADTVAVAGQRAAARGFDTDILTPGHRLWDTAYGRQPSSEQLALYDELLEAFPEHQEGTYNKAVSQFELGRVDEAILTMGRAVQLNKFHAEAAHNLGVYTLAKISRVAATMVELALGVKAIQTPLSKFHQWLSVQNIFKGHTSEW